MIHKAVQNIYLLEAGNRRLPNLYLPRKLDRYMSKWVAWRLQRYLRQH